MTSILRTFGLASDGSDIGWGIAAATTSENSPISQNLETALTPYLDALTKFREKTRVAAIAGETQAVLAAADELRVSEPAYRPLLYT